MRREGDIIESDDRQIVRNIEPAPHRMAHDAESHKVVETKEGRRRVCRPKQLLDRFQVLLAVNWRLTFGRRTTPGNGNHRSR